ncbi:MAG: hypothetical protein Q4B87_02435 [Candidatus Saccharibacteria bacterium]|nr:hypothetical protein [Candidatus Saccharibacteria bacterium]
MANSFTVSPMKQKISLKAGETYEGSIMVANPAAATSDFAFKTTISPYSVGPDGETMDFETKSDRTQIVNWTELDVTSGVLRPNEMKKITFVIRVPETAPAGGQYMSIGVMSDPNFYNQSGGVQETIEMCSLVLADVEGETTHTGEILENRVPSFVPSGTPETILVLNNKGNVHETAVTRIKIKNVITGEMVPVAGENNGEFETTVFPDAVRTVARKLDNLSPLGIYEVKQDIEYIGQTSSASSILLICPIWFIMLTISTVAAIIGVVIAKVVLKKKKAAI